MTIRSQKCARQPENHYQKKIVCDNLVSKMEKSGKCWVQNTVSEIQENPFDGWVTFQEAGSIVNRNQSTVRYWATTGKITAYSIGSYGLQVVNIDEVKEYSAKHAYRLSPKKRGKLKKFDK